MFLFPVHEHQPEHSCLLGCDLACEGNVHEMCGGYITLSVYLLMSASARLRVHRKSCLSISYVTTQPAEAARRTNVSARPVHVKVSFKTRLWILSRVVSPWSPMRSIQSTLLTTCGHYIESNSLFTIELFLRFSGFVIGG